MQHVHHDREGIHPPFTALSDVITVLFCYFHRANIINVFESGVLPCFWVIWAVFGGYWAVLLAGCYNVVVLIV